MSDIVPPCDCIELIDGQFTYRCECSNRGDGERAAAWCVEANHKASADYDKCTIEFLRKEAAEAAARIERLEAALRRWEQTGCPDCSGDCCAANIPISGCIMQETRAALEERT